MISQQVTDEARAILHRMSHEQFVAVGGRVIVPGANGWGSRSDHVIAECHDGNHGKNYTAEDVARLFPLAVMMLRELLGVP